MSGESGFSLKLAFSREQWLHTASASKLVLTPDNYVRREIFPQEKLKGVIYFADMDDKEKSLNNLNVLENSNTQCWPDPRSLRGCHDRHELMKALKLNKIIEHPIWVGAWEHRAESLLFVREYPFVVKTGNVHRGQNKHLITSWEEWASFPQWAGLATVEPFFEGISVRALVVGKRQWGIKTENSESWIKNGPGADQSLIRLDNKIRYHAEWVTSRCMLDVAGVDYIVDKQGNFHFLEINQYPGLGGYGDKVSNYITQYMTKIMTKMEV